MRGPADNNNRCRFRKKTNPFPGRPTEVCAATSTRHGVKYERPFPNGPVRVRSSQNFAFRLPYDRCTPLWRSRHLLSGNTRNLLRKTYEFQYIFLGCIVHFLRCIMHFLGKTRLCGREQTSTPARRKVLGRRRRDVKYFIKRPTESNATDVARCLHVFDYSCSIRTMRGQGEYSK